ncbi:hypothetical protein Tco_0459261 [Tanacetum coccineum]
MSSASSAVTYTSVYTDSEPGRVFWGADEEISDGGSPRVIVYGYDGLPMQPVAPPSPDYVPGPEHPPSPDYVPGPEHPPSPVEIPYIPEPEYPEYLVPSEDEAPMEDQPLPADASPAALSPGYVPDSDPDEDPEEDPEEDHADYPADGGDGDDEPSDDDDDDTDDEEEEPSEDDFHSGPQYRGHWAKEFHQIDAVVSVKVPVENFTLQSSVQLLWENTNSVRLNQHISPTAPSEPLKLIAFAMLLACASKAALTLSGNYFLKALDHAGWASDVDFLSGGILST